MKKVLSIVLVLMMVFAAVACTQTPTPSARRMNRYRIGICRDGRPRMRGLAVRRIDLLCAMPHSGHVL